MRFSWCGAATCRSQLDEANQNRRDGHAYFMPAAQQLTAGSRIALDIA
jgi:hypothetical protein